MRFCGSALRVATCAGNGASTGAGAVVAEDDGARRTATRLTTIGFDADDTLWQNEQFYRLTEARFAELLGDMSTRRRCRRGCSRRRSATSALYGFGIKGFTLSMIETAVEVTERPGRRRGDRRDPRRSAARCCRHPVETLPHARETLEALAGPLPASC